MATFQPIITPPQNVYETHEWYLHPTDSYKYISLIGRTRLEHTVTFNWQRMSSKFDLYFDGILESSEVIPNVFGNQVIFWNPDYKPDTDVHDEADPCFDPETRLLTMLVNGRRWAVGPNAIDPFDELKQHPIEYQFKDWMDERQYYYARGLADEYNQSIS